MALPGLRWRIVVLLVISALAACGPTAQAQPTGGTVAAGSATINALPNGIDVTQQSNRAVINWQSFSLQNGQVANFHLPGASSAVLNRVTTPNLPSHIFGAINSNGNVFLINPAGILVGPTGVINTHGFTASALDLPDADFMRGGDLHFRGTAPGSIINQGTIRTGAGGVTLIGGAVVNQGTITSDGGNVTLAVGTDVKITAAGTYVQADTQTLMNGVSPYAGVINNGGVIRATGAAKVGGEVYLVNPGGKVLQAGLIAAQQKQADGQLAGGRVEITGKEIALAGATIDASGDVDGGVVRIGGGIQGNDPAIKNAETLTVDEATTITADARQSGDAGSVVLYSEKNTDFRGTLNARALGLTGNGGFAEVSGKEVLGFTGKVDLSSVGGRNGTLLLDPTDFTIGAAEAAAIVASLAGSNVVVSTSPAGAGNGDVFILSPVVYNSGNSFSILAHRHINAVFGVQNGGAGDVNLVAGWNGVLGAPGGSGVQSVVTPFNMAAFFADPTSYGNNGGSLFVVNGAAVGSRFGNTNVAAWNVNLGGGNNSAQIGYLAAFVSGGNAVETVTGDIRVDTRNDVNLFGSGRTQIGHTLAGLVLSLGDVNLDLAVGGDITVNAQNVLLVPLSATAEAQIGHGLALGFVAGAVGGNGSLGNLGSFGTLGIFNGAAGGNGGNGGDAGPGGNATLNVDITAAIGGTITVAARSDILIGGPGLAQIGHGSFIVGIAGAAGGDGGLGGWGGLGGFGGLGTTGAAGGLAIGGGTNGVSGRAAPFRLPGNGTDAVVAGNGGNGGTGGAGGNGGNGGRGGDGGNAVVNLNLDLLLDGDINVSAGDNIVLTPADASFARIGNFSTIGLQVLAIGGNGGTGGLGGFGGAGGIGGIGGIGGGAVGNGGNGGNGVTQLGANKVGISGGNGGNAAVGGTGGSGGAGASGGGGGTGGDGGTGGNASISLSVNNFVGGDIKVESGTDIGLVAGTGLAQIGNAAVTTAAATAISGDGGAGGGAGFGGNGGTGGLGGTGGSSLGNGGNGGNGSNGVAPGVHPGGNGGNGGNAARGGNGGSGGIGGSGGNSGLAGNGGSSGNADVDVNLGAVAFGNLQTKAGRDLVTINGHIGHLGFNSLSQSAAAGTAGSGGAGGGGGQGGAGGQGSFGGVGIGTAGTAGTAGIGVGADGTNNGTPGTAGNGSVNGNAGAAGVSGLSGNGSQNGGDGGTGNATTDLFPAFVSIEGNNFVGVGQGPANVGRLIADAQSTFTSGVEYELRFYMPNRDSYQVTGASLNGYPAPPIGTNPLPNEQGQWAFGTGPYNLTTPDTNFAFYFNVPPTVPPIPPVTPRPPFIPTGIPLGNFVYDQFTRYQYFFDSTPGGGWWYLGNIRHEMGNGPRLNLWGVNSFDVFGGTPAQTQPNE